MKRTIVTTVALALLAFGARAEVSVDRNDAGEVSLFFEPADEGPWTTVRGVPEDDVLNPDGDLEGDGWPVRSANVSDGLPDVVWTSGGEDSDILFAAHDGMSWSAVRNLSDSSDTDELPVLASDQWGNRFVAWVSVHQDRRQVRFRAISGHPDLDLTNVQGLSSNPADARDPDLALHDDKVWVAYQVLPNGGDDDLRIVVDRVSVSRSSSGYVAHGVGDTIDLARELSTVTGLSGSSARLRPAIHAEDGHLWVEWIDEPGTLAYSEYVAGEFESASFLDIDELGGEEAARQEARTQVLGL